MPRRKVKENGKWRVAQKRMNKNEKAGTKSRLAGETFRHKDHPNITTYVNLNIETDRNETRSVDGTVKTNYKTEHNDIKFGLRDKLRKP